MSMEILRCGVGEVNAYRPQALLHCVPTDTRQTMGNFEGESEYAWENQGKLQVIKLAGLQQSPYRCSNSFHFAFVKIWELAHSITTFQLGDGNCHMAKRL